MSANIGVGTRMNVYQAEELANTCLVLTMGEQDFNWTMRFALVIINRQKIAAEATVFAKSRFA